MVITLPEAAVMSAEPSHALQFCTLSPQSIEAAAVPTLYLYTLPDVLAGDTVIFVSPDSVPAADDTVSDFRLGCYDRCKLAVVEEPPADISL